MTKLAVSSLVLPAILLLRLLCFFSTSQVEAAVVDPNRATFIDFNPFLICDGEVPATLPHSFSTYWDQYFSLNRLCGADPNIHTIGLACDTPGGFPSVHNLDYNIGFVWISICDMACRCIDGPKYEWRKAHI
jgi:hypothetical protein